MPVYWYQSYTSTGSSTTYPGYAPGYFGSTTPTTPTHDNKHHPELRPGEKWITNYTPKDDAYKHGGKHGWKIVVEFAESMSYTDLRVGERAYSEMGTLIPEMRPVFGKKDKKIEIWNHLLKLINEGEKNGC